MKLDDVLAYSAYNNAGVMLRLIEDAVGFGTVSLTYRDGDMEYDWTCKAGGRAYAARVTIPSGKMEKLSGMSVRCVQARKIAEEWKLGLKEDTADKPEEVKSSGELEIGSCFEHAGIFYMCMDIGRTLVVLEDHTGRTHVMNQGTVQMMLNCGFLLSIGRFDRACKTAIKASEAPREP